MNEARVIVVGGGAAGIAAATRLVQNGLSNVTVLEAEDRLGGRCNTVTLGDDDVDLGAQWIHGEIHNVVYDMASSLHLTKDSIFDLSDLSRFQFILPSGKIMSPDVSSTLLNYCMETLHSITGHEMRPYSAISLGEVYMKCFNENLDSLKDLKISDLEVHQFLEWYQKFENSIEASDSWYDVSFEGYLKYQDCGGNLHVAWGTGGYSKVIDLLLQKTPEANPKILPNVQFAKEVTQIIQNHEIVIKCADDSVFTADHVIISVSLGVLKHGAQSMFKPPLPLNKLSAINNLSFGVAEKLFIQFPHQWWPEDCIMLNILLDSDMKEKLLRSGKEWLIEVFAFFALDNAPNTLCGWVGGNSVRYISKLPVDVIRDDLYYFLKLYLGNIYTIPAPVRFTRSNWFGNSHFRGSYSFVSVQANVSKSSSEDLAEPILDESGKPLLMFAGEATHSHYFSTVHGAIETGWREANRLLSYYKKVRHVNTVIVGGGMAGLGAAITLQNNGVDFILLEAQKCLGGRVNSLHEEKTILEIGAQWLHGTDNDLYKWAQRESLLTDRVSLEGQGLYVRDDKTVIPQETVKQVSGQVNSILQKLENLSPYKMGSPSESAFNTKSVYQYLRSEFTKCLDQIPINAQSLAMQLFHWHNRFQLIDNACLSLDDLPVEEWGCYALNGNQENISFKNGYLSIVESISSHLSQDRIKLSNAVKRIIWYGGTLSDQVFCSNFHVISSLLTDELLSKLNLGKCRRSNFGNSDEIRPKNSCFPLTVLCEDGCQILANHIIVTCSIGYLKKHHQELFSPLLPPKYRSIIENIGFGPIDKIFLIFDECWWNPSIEGFQLIWSKVAEEELESSWFQGMTGFDVLSIKPPILLGWLGGLGAKQMEDMSEEKLAKDCQTLLQKFLHDIVPLPKKVVRSQWINNPYIAGGYSHATRKCVELGLRPVDLNQIIKFSTSSTVNHPLILFAGEANSEHDFSTTHGAYHTGIDQASEIIKYRTLLSELRSSGSSYNKP